MERGIRTQLSSTSDADSVSSFSSGFESMYSSSEPNLTHSALQQLQQRLDALERREQVSEHRPAYDVSERYRKESTSSNGSTVIGSAHQLQLGEIDVSKMLMENQLTLNSDNVDVMSQYQNVVIKVAIIGEKVRQPTACRCEQHNCTSLHSDSEQNIIHELRQKLQQYEKHNQELSIENQELKMKLNMTAPPEKEEAIDDDISNVIEGSVETCRAEIEEIKESKVEEEDKYVIKSVLDPNTDQQISFDDAIIKGIINLEKGQYYNAKTGSSFLIPEAMENNWIDVAYRRVHRSPQLKSSVGMLTITKNVLPKEKLIVKQVKDTSTGELMSVEEAVGQGIVSRDMSMYRDTTMQRDYRLIDAVEMGLVSLESDHQHTDVMPEKVQCIYEISGVVDKHTGNTLSYHDAVLKGLIIKDLLVCKDTVSGKYVDVTYAIINGMVKVDAVK